MAAYRRKVAAAAVLALSTPHALAGQPAGTEAPAAQTALDRRAQQLVDLFGGKIAFADYFAPYFQTAVPDAQFKAFTTGLIAQYGRALAVDSVTPTSARSGTVLLRFEKGVATVLLDVSDDADARVTGLRVTGVTIAGDGFDKVAAEIAALPGQTGFSSPNSTAAPSAPSPRPTPTGNSASDQRSSSISSTNWQLRSRWESANGPTSYRCHISAFRRLLPRTGPLIRR
jgi:hypothetical protein